MQAIVPFPLKKELIACAHVKVEKPIQEPISRILGATTFLRFNECRAAVMKHWRTGAPMDPTPTSKRGLSPRSAFSHSLLMCRVYSATRRACQGLRYCIYNQYRELPRR